MVAAFNRLIKRSIDIVGATAGLVLALPLLIIVAIVTKLTSRGPVFYSQIRVGVNRRRSDRRYCQQTNVSDHRERDRRRHDSLGKPFMMPKFRTMVVDAEKETGPVWGNSQRFPDNPGRKVPAHDANG